MMGVANAVGNDNARDGSGEERGAHCVKSNELVQSTYRWTVMTSVHGPGVGFTFYSDLVSLLVMIFL